MTTSKSGTKGVGDRAAGPHLRLFTGGGPGDVSVPGAAAGDGWPTVVARANGWPLELRVWTAWPRGRPEAVHHPSGVWVALRAL